MVSWKAPFSPQICPSTVQLISKKRVQISCSTEVNVAGSRLHRQALAEPRVNPHLWHQSLCHNQTQWFSLILLLPCSHKYLRGQNKTTLHFCPLRKNNKHLKYFCSFSPSTFLRSWWGRIYFYFSWQRRKGGAAQVESGSLKDLHSSALPALASLQDSTRTAWDPAQVRGAGQQQQEGVCEWVTGTFSWENCAIHAGLPVPTAVHLNWPTSDFSTSIPWMSWAGLSRRMNMINPCLSILPRSCENNSLPPKTIQNHLWLCQRNFTCLCQQQAQL